MAKPDLREQRRYTHFTDQHGRRWGAVIEARSGHPAGSMEPSFTAPLIPPSTYVRPDPDNDFGVRIHYDNWLRMVRQAWSDRDTQLRETATVLYGQEAANAIRNPPPELLQQLGPEPPLRPEPIEAAMSGNRWILGLTDAKPEWAYEFYPEAGEQETTEPVKLYPDVEEPEDLDQHREIIPVALYALTRKGLDHWQMPDGSFVKGKKDEALEELIVKFPEHAEKVLGEETEEEEPEPALAEA